MLRNRCGEKRLSDLMLLSIEGDISIDQNKVIDIYKQPNEEFYYSSTWHKDSSYFVSFELSNK